MMKYYLLFAIVLMSISCKQVEEKDKETVTVNSENSAEKENNNVLFDIYDFSGIEPLLNRKDDKTYVVNFWATWCVPCVKELPNFENVQESYRDRNVEVILVSLDFPNKYETKLKPFIVERNLKSKVVALNDPDMNSWIPKVSEEWSGAIPATIIYNKNSRKFYEKSFTLEELENELKPFLN